jgi:hypothetical protein
MNSSAGVETAVVPVLSSSRFSSAGDREVRPVRAFTLFSPGSGEADGAGWTAGRRVAEWRGPCFPLFLRVSIGSNTGQVP